MSRPLPSPRRGFVATLAALLVLLPPALALSGCKTEAPGLDAVRVAIDRQLPGTRLEPEVTFSLGRFSLGLVKGLSRLGDDEDGEHASRILSHLRRIEIGVYELVPTGAEAANLGLPAALEQELRRQGAEVLVRVRDEGEQTLVFFEPEGEAIRTMYVVALDDTELVLLRLQGRLDHLLAEALADHPESATALFLGEGESSSEAADREAAAAVEADDAGTEPPEPAAEPAAEASSTG